MASLKLKTAIIQGKVEVRNPHTGQVRVFLKRPNGEEISVLVGSLKTKELAPKYVPCKQVIKSRNLDKLLRQGLLKLV